ncbi:hypothetical protein BJF84_27090 [Rhodococcus sp. CUA-806]|nr:hypothetical protein BJF84_27090 [Rhodococcus sp. CUA-806]
MIPNITRGAKMTGLVVYLAGPGKSNEHENQHVVAGHESVLLAAPAGELTHADAIELAHELDTARVVFGTEVTVTSKRKMNAAIGDGVSRSVALADATSDQNVWHCSLSLNPDEGELSDEKWAAIAADFMKEMDFETRTHRAHPHAGLRSGTARPRQAATTFTSRPPLSARTVRRSTLSTISSVRIKRATPSNTATGWWF